MLVSPPQQTVENPLALLPFAKVPVHISRAIPDLSAHGRVFPAGFSYWRERLMRLSTPLLAAGFLVTLASASGAQSAKASPQTQQTKKRPGGSVVQAITDAENLWIRALEKNDARALDAILAPTYSDTDEEGNRATKQDVLTAIKSGDVKFDSISLVEIHVRPYGNAAVATGVGLQKGAYKGQPFAPKIAFTDTFVRENGVWRAVASQRTAVH